MSLKIIIKNTSSDPKKCALGFFSLRKIEFLEKELFLKLGNREIKAE
jgi:hypothetical protein